MQTGHGLADPTAKACAASYTALLRARGLHEDVNLSYLHVELQPTHTTVPGKLANKHHKTGPGMVLAKHVPNKPP